MFFEIYEDLKASGQWKSFLTGRNIPYGPDNIKMFVCCFAHVLPKGSYPELKLVRENIVILSPYEHTLYDQSTQIKRDEYASASGADWKKLDRYKQFVLKVIRPKYCKTARKF